MGRCRISLRSVFQSRRVVSRWTDTPAEIHIEAAAGLEPHDLAMELLLCLGQALWERVTDAQRAAFLGLLAGEMDAGVAGEIDEDVFALKSAVLRGKKRVLRHYCRAAFAATAAEFVHALWHDLTVRTGPGHLPPESLRRRLELFADWFPPDRGYRLFPEV